MSSDGRPRIVILGAGFAGLQVANDLAKRLPREEDAEIILIDRNNFLLFTPMLIELLQGQVNMLHIASSTRRLNKRIRFEQGEITRIDIPNKAVELNTCVEGCDTPALGRTIVADYLVIALGAVPNFYGIPGLREQSFTMTSLCDAVTLRNRVLAILERANAEPDREKRRELLTFVVGGGGFSGVETAAALNDLARDSAQFFPNIDSSDIKVYVIEALPRLLPELDADLASYAKKKLEECGVEVLLNAKIIQAGANYVELEDRCVYAHTLIWTGGVRPSPQVADTDCSHDRKGSIMVDEYCRVTDCPEVWALGDCAHVPKTGSDKPYAPTAQNATREGAIVAHNIAATLKGTELKPFVFTPIGELAALGGRTGVASIRGIKLSGFPAWFMWRTVYLWKLPTLRQRFRVAADWTLDLIFGREVIQLPTECFITGLNE